MHLYPACVCWTIRWHTADPLAAHLRTSSQAAAEWEHGGMRDLVLLPMLPYIVWAALYYLKVRSGQGACWQERDQTNHLSVTP